MLPLALTMGDPAGVGGEITLKAWKALHNAPTETPFFLIGDANHLKSCSKSSGISASIELIETPADAKSVFATALPVLHRPLDGPVDIGTPDPKNAPSVMASIEMAVRFVEAGDAAAIVTNPIHKQSLYQAGFKFPGHTEYLAFLAGITTPPVMMLACPSLRVIPVTVHVSLREAIDSLTTDDIITISLITAEALANDFGIIRPRLAIAGINPHAGEGGAMGHEEDSVISPAIAELAKRGIDATGPWPPDTMFHGQARESYDAAICMYHDQALIPIKTVDFDGAVNVTLGLPFVRTSPDHGTAFDIAGSGKASETSLLAAIALASQMAYRRNS